MIRKIISSKLMQFTVLMAITVFLAVLMTSENVATSKLRNFAFDSFNRLDPREPTGQVVIVDIDEISMERIGQWPWSRNVLADLVLNLRDLGAKVTAFDVVFAEEDRTSSKAIVSELRRSNSVNQSVIQAMEALPDNDMIFANAITEAGNVVTGFTYAEPEQTRRMPYASSPVYVRKSDVEVLDKNVEFIKGVATNIPILSRAAAGNGSFITSADSDGLIRAAKVIITAGREQEDAKFYPALSLEALRVAHNAKEFIKIGIFENTKFNDTFLSKIQENQYLIRIGESGWQVPIKSDGRIYLKFRKVEDDEYIPAYQILDRNHHGAIQNKIKDKIVLIGTSAEGLRDIRSTPLEAFIPGVEVHLNAIEQILQNKFIFRDGSISWGIELFYIIVIGLLLTLASLFLGPVFMATLTIISITGSVLGTYYLYTAKDMLFDPINPSIALFLIFVVATIFNYIRSEAARREIKGAFGLYISPDFMKELTDNPDKLTLGGEIRDLTVMFTDIRNFTTISESMTPEALINTMNDFLTPMSDVVMKTRGTIDKYMGDAMMAFWNAPLDDASHARHAVEAALTMKKALEPVNAALKLQAEKEGREPLLLAAGIGINTGPCAVGNMGSKQRFAYSALGDAVNLASRLEGQTKSYGLDLLVGEETITQIGNFAYVEIDLIKVKGKTKPVRIYTVLGTEMMGKREAFLKFRDTHGKFLDAYRGQDFKMAMEWINECQQNEFGKLLIGYYRVMLARMKDFQTNKPPQDWDGVYVATTK